MRLFRLQKDLFALSSYIPMIMMDSSVAIILVFSCITVTIGFDCTGKYTTHNNITMMAKCHT